MIRRASRQLATALAVLAGASCSGDGTGPSTPAMPTGTLLAFHPAQIVYTVDAETGETVEIANNGTPIFGWVSGTLGPGGKFASGFAYQPWELRLLEVATGVITTVFPITQEVLIGSTRISPDGKRLAFTASGWVPERSALMIVDLASKVTTVPWIAPEDDPEYTFGHLRWLPDQSGFITLAFRTTSVTVAHFDLSSGVITNLSEPMSNMKVTMTLDLSPDGRTIVYNDPDRNLRFITRSGEPAPGFPTDVKGVLPAFSPDGRMMAWSRFREGGPGLDGIWFYRFSDGEMWRAMPEGSPITWVLDWE